MLADWTLEMCTNKEQRKTFKLATETYPMDGQLFIALIATSQNCPGMPHTHLVIGQHKPNGQTFILDSIAKTSSKIYQICTSNNAHLLSHLSRTSINNYCQYYDFADKTAWQPGTAHSYKAYSLTHAQLNNFHELVKSVPREYFTEQNGEWRITKTELNREEGLDTQHIEQQIGNNPADLLTTNTCRDTAVALIQYVFNQKNIGYVPAFFRGFPNSTAFDQQKLENFGDYFYILPPPPPESLKGTNIIQYTALTELFSHLEYLAKENAHQKFEKLKTLYNRILENPHRLKTTDLFLEALNTHRKLLHAPLTDTHSHKITAEVLTKIYALNNIPNYLTKLNTQQSQQIIATVSIGLLSLAAIGFSCLSFGIAPSLVFCAALTSTLFKASIITSAIALTAYTIHSIFKVNKTHKFIACTQAQTCSNATP